MVRREQRDTTRRNIVPVRDIETLYQRTTQNYELHQDKHIHIPKTDLYQDPHKQTISQYCTKQYITPPRNRQENQLHTITESLITHKDIPVYNSAISILNHEYITTTEQIRTPRDTTIERDNYSLEELLEQYRISQNSDNTLLHHYNPEITTQITALQAELAYQRELTPRKPYDKTFFDDAARKLNPDQKEALSAALQKFNSEGRDFAFSDAQFGTMYIQRFLKEGATIAPEELAKYGMRYEMQQSGSHFGQQFSHKYFDTKFNFCLTYEGELIASVGFDAEDQTLYLWQIQGIRGHHDQLKPFKWTQALVTYALEWASKNHIPAMRVISVDNNKWANMSGHLTKEQGKMLYDVTASRLKFDGKKFARDGTTGDYVMNLQDTNVVQQLIAHDMQEKKAA